jgi:hypothetical protein
VNPKQVAQALSTHGDVLRRVEQFVDQFGPLVRRLIRDKLGDLGFAWEPPANVQHDAPDELAVGREARRHDVHLFQVRLNIAVDEVVPGNRGVRLAVGARSVRNAASTVPQ